jgi:hypothetical protein
MCISPYTTGILLRLRLGCCIIHRFRAVAVVSLVREPCVAVVVLMYAVYRWCLQFVSKGGGSFMVYPDVFSCAFLLLGGPDLGHVAWPALLLLECDTSRASHIQLSELLFRQIYHCVLA